MSSLTAERPSSGCTCEDVQRAIVEGVLDGSPEPLRRHAGECAECRFLGELSRRLGTLSRTQLTASRTEAGPLGPFVDAFDRAVETGEPIFTRYRLVRRVGRGGQGVVYRALDTETGEDTVAVKLVRCDLEPAEASSLEVVHARRVRHPCICRVYHTERHGALRLIVMEFIEGESLALAVRRLSRGQKRAIFRQISEAVHAAHEAGVLHLDLKPQNVLVRTTGEPVVTDFGLSASLAAAGSSVATGGTRGYMAPEQERGEVVDRRTDVHALGRILAFMFPSPPRRLRKVVRRATASDPAGRFPDARALLSAVERPHRKRRALIAGVTAAVLALLVTGWLLSPSSQGRRATWHADLWGPDHLPANAWNVAVSRAGRALPAIAIEHPAFGCARNVADLIDGQAAYQDWQHGYAFHGPLTICVNLQALGYCGGLRDDASLCVMKEGERARRLALTVREKDRVGTVDGELGQLEQAVACDHDDAVVISLDRPRPIFAVRAWFRDGIPTRFGIDAEEPSGGWRTVFHTVENPQGTKSAIRLPERAPADSVPVTTDFSPVVTRRLRYRVRCDEKRPYDPKTPGHPVWLYEIEVFSRLARWEAFFRSRFEF